MAHTQAINEAAPAGTDSASGGDDEFRALKRDIRERMELEHYWNDGLTGNQQDGKHINITIGGTGVVADKELIKGAGYSITGAGALPMVDLSGTWNTTGAPTAIQLSIIDTLSNVTSKLLNLLVGGVSKFFVNKAGTVYIAGDLIVDGAISGAGSSGTYLPTASSLSNLTTAAPGSAQWVRIGDMVIVSGNIALEATFVATNCSCLLDLPVPAVLGAPSHLAGFLGAVSISPDGFGFDGLSPTNARLFFTSNSTSPFTAPYIYMYRI